MYGTCCESVCPTSEAAGVSVGVGVGLLLGSQSDSCVTDEARASDVGQDQWGPGASLATTMEVPPDVTSHDGTSFYLLWSISLVPVLWLPLV